MYKGPFSLETLSVQLLFWWCVASFALMIAWKEERWKTHIGQTKRSQHLVFFVVTNARENDLFTRNVFGLCSKQRRKAKETKRPSERNRGWAVGDQIKREGVRGRERTCINRGLIISAADNVLKSSQCQHFVNERIIW